MCFTYIENMYYSYTKRYMIKGKSISATEHPAVEEILHKRNNSYVLTLLSLCYFIISSYFFKCLNPIFKFDLPVHIYVNVTNQNVKHTYRF
ncbi:unnamed protein product [Larinioides sclopetarius]|uniref:Uncharacterized protein n=1 Tax=Larinioides sclopetarius TaxID=280406 RepID=A0AAV2B186_9ARAC